MLFPKPFAVDILDSGTLGRALVRAETAPTAHALLDASEWATTQTRRSDNTSPYFSLEPDSEDDESDPFNVVASTGVFDGAGSDTGTGTGAGRYDFVVRMGHNVAAGGGPVNTSRPSLAIEFEQNYLFGGGQFCEWHLAFRRQGAAFDQRPISAFLRWDAEPTRDNNQLAFLVEQVFHRRADGTTNLFTSDSTGGFRTTDVPIGTEHSGTSANHLVLRGPTGMASNVRFMQVLKNSSELAFMTRYGEFKLDGTLSGAGTGENNAMLEVNGRTGTSGVVRFRAEDGTTNRFYINSGTGAFAAIQSNGQWQHSGPLQVFDTNGSTQRFRVNEAGNVATDQVTAASALGALNGVWPIRNIAGTIIGYLPTYATFTP